MGYILDAAAAASLPRLGFARLGYALVGDELEVLDGPAVGPGEFQSEIVLLPG